MLLKSFALTYLKKNHILFFLPFHLCFPIIASSIFHLSAIKHYSFSLHMALHTCYSYLEYISIPEYISQFNILLMNQIKSKWFGASADTNLLSL